MFLLKENVHLMPHGILIQMRHKSIPILNALTIPFVRAIIAMQMENVNIFPTAQDYMRTWGACAAIINTPGPMFIAPKNAAQTLIALPQLSASNQLPA
jgi:hypothetical protein